MPPAGTPTGKSVGGVIGTWFTAVVGTGVASVTNDIFIGSCVAAETGRLLVFFSNYFSLSHMPFEFYQSMQAFYYFLWENKFCCGLIRHSRGEYG